MKKNKLLILPFIFIFLTSCGIQINDALIDEIINAELNPDNEGTSTANILEVDQTDNDNTATGFSGGTHTGTAYSSGVLTLNTTTNNSELHENWTPHYSDIDMYYKFNGTGTVNDSDSIPATVGTNAVASNTDGLNFEYTTGKLNTSLSFDDNDSTLYATANGYHFGVRPFTVAFWTNCPTSTSSNWFYREIRTGFTRYFGIYSRRDNGALQVSSRANDLSFHVGHSIGSAGIVCDNNWHHIVMTTNSIDNLKLYRDGANVLDLNFTYVSTDIDTVRIGGDSSAFQGDLDEFARWTRVLTEEEINIIFNRQRAAYAGEMYSRIMDSRSSSSQWTNIDWITSLPFGKELPGSNGSESSTDYSSLVGSTGSTSDNNLMSGLVALWRFNESNYSNVVDEVIDSSGNNHHGQTSNEATTSASSSIFNRSLKLSTEPSFDSSGDFVTIDNHTDFDFSTEVSISAWIYKVKNDTNGRIIGKGATDGFQLITRTDNGIEFYHHDGTTRFHIRTSASTIPRNQWTHILVTSGPGGTKMYINGIDTSLAGPTSTPYGGDTNTANVLIGAYHATSQYFQGFIDEIAIWNRVLHEDEILQLYRRGANRIKYQVRSCSTTDCSDQDALTGDGWKGPGGSNLTYFSEAYNNTSITSSCGTAQECYPSELSLQGNVGATKPSIYFNSFGTDGLLGIDNNRYFQYRVIMESDDENTACDSGTATCMPELKSVIIGPAHTYEE